MDNSFEERLARINAKNGGGRPAPELAPNPPTPKRSNNAGSNSLKLLALSFLGGVVVIGGVTFALPIFKASQPVSVFSEVRD